MVAAAASLAMVAGVALPQQRGQEQQETYFTRLFIPLPLLANQKRLHFSPAFLGDTSPLHQRQLLRVVHAQSSAMASARAAVGAITKEAATGIEFSNALSIPGASKELSLVGVGVRERQIAFLNVKVYAVGFYVDAASLVTDDSWNRKVGSDLAKEEGFFKFLIDAPIEKSLKIVLARDVQGSLFWGALDEALTPRLKAVGAGPAGQEALASFGAVFQDRAMKKGTTVYLTWSPPRTLHIAMASGSGAPESSIESPTLPACLFDVFLGPYSVSPSLRAAIAKGFPFVS